MNIFNKIEEIREKPEHIRVRWVWIMTVIFMFFVVSIWMLSISAQKGESSDLVVPENQKKAILELQQGKKSIQDATKQLKR